MDMVWKILEVEVWGECGILYFFKDLKFLKFVEVDVLGILGFLYQIFGGLKFKKVFKFVGQIKLLDMGFDVLKKMCKCGNFDGVMIILLFVQFFEDMLQKKVVGEIRVEIISFFFVSLDNFCLDLVQKNFLLLELGVIKLVFVNIFQYYVFVVDDSSID